jgi:hypothetical protein
MPAGIKRKRKRLREKLVSAYRRFRLIETKRQWPAIKNELIDLDLRSTLESGRSITFFMTAGMSLRSRSAGGTSFFIIFSSFFLYCAH